MHVCLAPCHAESPRGDLGRAGTAGQRMQREEGNLKMGEMEETAPCNFARVQSPARSLLQVRPYWQCSARVQCSSPLHPSGPCCVEAQSGPPLREEPETGGQSGNSAKSETWRDGTDSTCNLFNLQPEPCIVEGSHSGGYRELARLPQVPK